MEKPKVPEDKFLKEQINPVIIIALVVILCSVAYYFYILISKFIELYK